MNIKLEPGKYVVAVSGGVDSMALLDLLRRLPKLQLVVAHFDHGIRPDSAADRRLVMESAREYGLKFVYEEGNLGADASEETAREARYDFLRRVRTENDARAIITAHHRDDVLETAVHNLLRGTGWRGLAALRTRDEIIRPLLGIEKSELIVYARDNAVKWRDDTTNTDLRYRRNYIRCKLIPRFSEAQRDELMGHIEKLEKTGAAIEKLAKDAIGTYSAGGGIDRRWFINLPHNVAREILIVWLRSYGVFEISSNLVERLVTAAKTYQAGKQADIDKNYVLRVGSGVLTIYSRNRQKHSV